MADQQNSPFALSAAHNHFSAQCFNRTWDLIDKPTRSEADNIEMLLTAKASLWHWTQRSDCTSKNLSIGHWQISRVYALLQSGQEAMRHAELSLKYSDGLRAFYGAYAHEAIARAAIILGDKPRATAHLQMARASAAGIEDAEEREQLEKDLGELVLAVQTTEPRGRK